MYKLLTTLSLTLASASASSSIPADDHFSCGTVSLTDEEKHEMNMKVQHKLKEMKANGIEISSTDPIDIDVYFHVITSSSGEGALTSSQIDAQISALNDIYSVATPPFTFTLVGTTVSANDAWFNAETSQEHQATYKKLLRRGSGADLNFYTVKFTGGLLGFAYYPNVYSISGYEYLDGAVNDYRSVPGVDSSYSGSYDKGGTGVHEVGHWLGLQHTFENGCEGDGDEVDDTPAVSGQQFGCSERDTCPDDGLGNDMIENFMGYTNDYCKTSLTAGQFTRARDMFTTLRAPTVCVINCDPPTSEPTSQPTVTPIDYTPYETVMAKMKYYSRVSRINWIGSPDDVSSCRDPLRHNRIRIAGVASVSLNGAFFAKVDVLQRKGKVSTTRTTLDFSLKAAGGGGPDFEWSQLLFSENDYVTFISEFPAGQVVDPDPVETHKIGIKLVLDELVDSEGAALSFPSGSNYEFSVTVQDFNTAGDMITDDCIKEVNVKLVANDGP